MYAIVEIAGQQFKVEEGKKIFVHRLENEPGNDVEFDKVLLVEDGETIVVGEPTIKDFVVEGKVVDNVRGDKVIVFKMKRKKGYRIKNGHRQNFTQIEITGIGDKETLRNRAPKKEAVKKAEKKVTEVVEEPAVEKKTTGRKTAVKKTAVKKEAEAGKEAKKPEAKKTAAKKPAAKKTSKTKE
jgi:large subunit ribosomal protein L21